jgi:hypothetical protein
MQTSCFIFSIALGLVSVGNLFAQPAPDSTIRKDREATAAVVHPAVRSPLRPFLNLDGPWDFSTDPNLEGETQEWFQPGKPLPGARQLQVPGCWEAQGVGEPGLSNAKNKFIYEPVNVRLKHAYTGAAWYKKEFDIPAGWAGKQIWLKIGGVNAQGWFWINGKYVGHDWSYCGVWKYNVTDLVTPGKKATLAVLVRNDIPSRRGESNCVRTYGGLFRSVELDATPAVSLDYVYSEPLIDQKKVRLHVALRNTSGVASSDAFSLDIKVSLAQNHQQAGSASQAVVILADPVVESVVDVPLNPLYPWSPENAALYTADIVLKKSGKPVDGWVDRFGVRTFEVKGGDLYLNNVRTFLRGCGDDHAYPITICSPASVEEHAKHLRIVKDYGFNTIRLHTHCESPEFYEAADEVGMLIQPELPYYGSAPGKPLSPMSGAGLLERQDLTELVSHYRRFTSLAIYCGGNEQNRGAPGDVEMRKMANQLDASRPYVNLDGGNNTRENSEINCYGYGFAYWPASATNWPHVKHEYMSLGINEDPRLGSKYTGGYAPNLEVKEVKPFVTGKVGLDWKWAEACFGAGYQLQGIWHKIGIEAARVDPFLDGFSLWLMIDLTPSGQCGVLDMFWGRKTSTAEFFRGFNAPTVILGRVTAAIYPALLGFNPATVIYSEGDTLELDWVVSHFQPNPVVNGTLSWQLVADGRPLAEGQIEQVNVAAGAVPVVGRSRITMPAVTKAVKARLTARLDAANTSNSWDIWIFPRFQPRANAGKGIAASPRAFEFLESRYPGVVRLGTPEAASAQLVVAQAFSEIGVVEALEQGKDVVCLSLPGYNMLRTGNLLAEWATGINNQTGTAIAEHPVFGTFPNSGYLDQGWFRLVDRAEKLDPGHQFRNVDPLMVGTGRASTYNFGTLGYTLGYNLYTFQAKSGKGRLLATGLKLSSDNPESVYLLDQFIQYARSNRFCPTGTLDVVELKEKSSTIQNFNGWSETINANESVVWPSFEKRGQMNIVRQFKKVYSVAWMTGRWKPAVDGMVTFRWVANLGGQSQPAGGKYSLSIGDQPLLDFDISLKSAEWRSGDGKSVLKYTLKLLFTNNEEGSGIMELTVPQGMLPATGAPVLLRVSGSGPDSRRYFGLAEPM